MYLLPVVLVKNELSTSNPLSQPSNQNAADINTVYDILYMLRILIVHVMLVTVSHPKYFFQPVHAVSHNVDM